MVTGEVSFARWTAQALAATRGLRALRSPRCPEDSHSVLRLTSRHRP
ncbi:hypothetical protein SHJG_7960 [Streptomyces hygroscopicus subsp. jinggangensis 5008]|nr:hypothetical protein SHJG_7960 [Streptomyces hygroscopicus subsp. jinggangensis 5008]AGF67384.1 hypothetical protein SHJGH_7722 [Streptomyces hygroscopicus subsp. jinggangensis TL01]